jgi:hypothetical protein
MATKWDCYISVRFSIHSLDWIESLRRRRYPQSGPAFDQSFLQRIDCDGKSESMVHSRRVCVAGARNLWKLGERNVDWAGIGRRRFVTLQKHWNHRKSEPAISRRGLQHFEPLEFWPAQHNSFFERRGQPFRRPHHDNGNLSTPNPIGIEADFLVLSQCPKRVPRSSTPMTIFGKYSAFIFISRNINLLICEM